MRNEGIVLASRMEQAAGEAGVMGLRAQSGGEREQGDKEIVKQKGEKS